MNDLYRLWIEQTVNLMQSHARIGGEFDSVGRRPRGIGGPGREVRRAGVNHREVKQLAWVIGQFAKRIANARDKAASLQHLQCARLSFSLTLRIPLVRGGYIVEVENDTLLGPLMYASVSSVEHLS